MATFEEDQHPRARGKFAAKPMSPEDKKLHATVPVKRAKGGIKQTLGGTQQAGDLHRPPNKKEKMNTGKRGYKSA